MSDVRRAARVGALVGGVVFTWMLTRGTFDLLRHQNSGDFFDAQAHAFLHGHLDVDPHLLKIEAFFHSCACRSRFSRIGSTAGSRSCRCSAPTSSPWRDSSTSPTTFTGVSRRPAR